MRVVRFQVHFIPQIQSNDSVVHHLHLFELKGDDGTSGILKGGVSTAGNTGIVTLHCYVEEIVIADSEAP